MFKDLSTYEIFSLILACATIFLAIVSIIIAICSSRHATKEVNRLIKDTNRATRASIAVEYNKLEVEDFKNTMQSWDLTIQKKKLEEDRVANAEKIKMLEEQIERHNRIHQKISSVQQDMSKAINNFN